jgi:SAM-dependent methyltransferase
MAGEEGRHGATEPSPWVRRFLPLVAPGGSILDLACGRGRHTRLALDKGYRVTAVDRTLEPMRDLAGRPGLSSSRPISRAARTFRLRAGASMALS